MLLHYPSYLNKPDEVIENIGNATVPEGTSIKWTFYTKNSDNLIFAIGDDKKVFTSEKDNFVVNIVARNSFDYYIFNKNQYFTSKDTLKDEITVIKDMYPEIFVQNQQDSDYQDRYYFKGNIKDDYGFSALHFVYSKYDENGKLIESQKSIPISFQKDVTIQDFYFYFDPSTFNLKPGEKIDYYFVVSDNDGVNGHKSSKSNVSSFKLRSLDEISKDIDKAQQQTKSDFNKLIDESSQLMKDIDKLQKQMLNEKDLTWQDKKKLEQLMDQYKKLSSSSMNSNNRKRISKRLKISIKILIMISFRNRRNCKNVWTRFFLTR